MKKTVYVLLSLLLSVSLLAACGSQKETTAAPVPETAGQETKATEAPQPESTAPESTEKTTETEAKTTEALTEPETTTEEETQPSGPAELNQVIYEANGIRITAVSYEDHMAEIGSLKDNESVFDLTLHLERTTEEPLTVAFPSVSVNGFRYVNYQSFLGGKDKDWQDWLIYRSFSLSSESETDILISMLKHCAVYLDIRSVGELGFVLSVGKEGGAGYFDTARVDLGREAEPKCPVVSEAGENLSLEAYARLTNPMDSPVLTQYIVRLTREDGSLACFSNMMDGSFRAASLREGTVHSGAASEPLGFDLNGAWLVDESGKMIDGDDIVSFSLEYFAAVPTKQADITAETSWSITGRADWNDTFVLIGGTWPESMEKVTVNCTLLCYDQNDQLVYVKVNQQTVNRNDPNYDEMFIGVYKRDRDPEYRFELYINYVQEYQEK